MLGIQPQIGRLFTPAECKWNGPEAVLLSLGLWNRGFGSDPGIVGRALTIDNEPATAFEGKLTPLALECEAPNADCVMPRRIQRFPLHMANSARW